MKTVVLTPASSSRERSSPAGRDRSEGRGDSSCYFPGCRKDTNCHCDICLASMDATRDLIPSGSSAIRKSSAAFKPAPARPLFLPEPWTPPPTPESASTLVVPTTPPVRSTGRSRLTERARRKERSWGCGVLGSWISRFLAGLFLVWMVDSGFPAVALREFGPKLTPEVVRQIGEKSQFLSGDLRGRLGILQQKIEQETGERVSSCSFDDSIWALNQEGRLFFHWRCVIYKSIAEEVSVWGSPLRTSGLLPTGWSSRSLTLLSGRITEWPDGKLQSTLRTNNSSSWTYGKWSSAAVQLEVDTWVLEYGRSPLFQGPGLIRAALEMLRMKALKLVKELKQEPWRLLLLDTCPDRCHQSPVGEHFTHPT